MRIRDRWARRGAAAALGALLALAAASGLQRAWAQAADMAVPGGYGRAPQAVGALTGTLARIRHSGTVHLGYRAQAVPFSVAPAGGGPPYGYSIDLCLAIVEQIAEATGGRPLRIEYRAVTPADRIERVVAGDIDLECGATTDTAQRRLRVAFSPVTFITTMRLAVPRGSGLRSRRDLDGRTVAVAAGTTNEAALREIVARAGLRTVIATVEDVPHAFALVAAGKADAVASDDVLLLGHLARSGQREAFDMVGEPLSYEAYGLMFARDDPQFAGVVAAALRRLAETRELRWIYQRWFVRTLPSGIRLGLPMSPELERAFQLIGLPPD